LSGVGGPAKAPFNSAASWVFASDLMGPLIMLPPNVQFTRGKDRLFQPFMRSIHIMDAMSIAMSVMSGQGVSPDENSLLGITCNQFQLAIYIPAIRPTRALVKGVRVETVGVSFGPKPVKPDDVKSINTEEVGLSLVDPIFVDFYEKHRKWIAAKYSGETQNWPPIFNFARMLRNFISHHEGRVHFDNPNASPVSWHQLSYAPRDEGRQVVGGDLYMGDILFLMYEMGAALDLAGCPLNP